MNLSIELYHLPNNYAHLHTLLLNRAFSALLCSISVGPTVLLSDPRFIQFALSCYAMHIINALSVHRQEKQTSGINTIP